MPWYFYSGNVPVPVKRVDGEIVSVRPRSHIEAKLEDIRKYGTRMARCAPPKDMAPPVPPAPEPEAPIKGSSLAAAIKELGITKDSGVPPVSVDPDKTKSATGSEKSRRPKTKLSPGDGE